MVTALIPEEVDEIIVMPVPPVWRPMPHDLREELAWWQLVRGIMIQQSTEKNLIMLGPPHSIEWVFSIEVAEVANIKLRHPCPECRDGLTSGVDHLREGPDRMVAVAQFTQKYLRDMRQAGNPYKAYRTP